MPKTRLLIVEDDIDIANMLKIYFSGMEFDVDVAVRGSDALERTKQVLPHLIVLDIMLPDIDGYEVCRTLRVSTRTSHIPVIFLTQKDERSDRLQGLELGADDYITKPFDIEELKLRVQGAIRRSERESLTDPRSGLPAGRLIEEQLRHIIRENIAVLLKRVPGVQQLEELQAHRFGPHLILNLTIGIDGGMTVRMGDAIATKVEALLYESIPNLRRVHVHYHPANRLRRDMSIEEILAEGRRHVSEREN